MKKIIASGTATIDIIENTFTNKDGEEISYKRVGLKVSNKTTEELELKSPSSYELLEQNLVNSTSTQDKKLTSRNNEIVE